MPEDPLIVLVNGLPGSGKTTVAAGLGRRYERGVVLEGDRLQLDLIVRGGVDVGDEPVEEGWRQLALRWRNLAALAVNFTDAGFTVVVDSLTIPSLLGTFHGVVAPRPVAYVHLDPTEAVRRERDERRPGRTIGSRYDDIAAEFDPLRGVGVWIDSSGQRPEETITAAHEALASGRGRLGPESLTWRQTPSP